ncbi:MAG: hypothetical protein ACTSUE_19430 [Promethearchaeota archaeon]
MKGKNAEPGNMKHAYKYTFLLFIVMGLMLTMIFWDFIGGDEGVLNVTLMVFLPTGLVSGFVGGVYAHSRKNGGSPSLIILIIVTVISVIIMAPEGFIITAVLWGSMLSMGTLGGYLSERYIDGEVSLVKFISKPMFLVIFILVWTPLLVPLFSFTNNVPKTYSAYNTDPSGASSFREQIEAAGYTNIQTCISSYSLLSRIDEPFVLVIQAPNRFFNPISDIPFLLEFLRNNGSLLITHEQGSTTTFMIDAFLSSLIAGITFPFTFFASGILKDNASYYKENTLPVITAGNLAPHPITSGITSLVLNRAGGLMLPEGLGDLFGWDIVATASPSYSWVDKREPGFPNGNGSFDPIVDSWPIPFSDQVENAINKLSGGVVTLDLPPIPMGGFPIPVVATAEYGSGSSPGRIICTADASMFTNEMMNEPGFDNRQFALNCIDWLANGNQSRLIVFDEAHLKPTQFQDPTVPAIYGAVLSYVGYLSSSVFTAPFYPFLALRSIKRWLPQSEEQKLKIAKKKLKHEKKKEKKAQSQARRSRRVLGKTMYLGKVSKKEEEKIKGILKKSTYFMQKLNYYMEQSDYGQALDLLYLRLKRMIGKKFHPDVDTVEVIDAIVDKQPNVDRRALSSFFKRINLITRKRTIAGKEVLAPNRVKIKNRAVFERIYFEMITIQEYLENL